MLAACGQNRLYTVVHSSCQGTFWAKERFRDTFLRAGKKPFSRQMIRNLATCFNTDASILASNL
jgi:hypothetical protein